MDKELIESILSKPDLSSLVSMYIVDELAERLNAKKIVEIKAVIVEGVDLDELKELCKTTDTKILVELLQLCNASMGQVFAENTYYEYQDKKEIK